jgi:Uma2 family endonuclease
MVIELKIRKGERLLPTRRMTYEQFLDWADEDTYAEWVDGEVELMSPASEVHQDVSDFLTAVMRVYVEEHASGRILSAPFQMKLSQLRRGREPDILFIANQNLSRLKRNYLDGPADIAIEIISPESVLRDRGIKYAEYEAGGVREYWVFDPESQRADFFVLGEDGRYERAHPDADGVYHSAVLPAFWLNVNWLWGQPLPNVLQIVREWEAQK